MRAARFWHSFVASFRSHESRAASTRIKVPRKVNTLWTNEVRASGRGLTATRAPALLADGMRGIGTDDERLMEKA